MWGLKSHRFNTLNIFTSDFRISFIRWLTLLLIRLVLEIQEAWSFFFLHSYGTMMFQSLVINRQVFINLSWSVVLRLLRLLSIVHPIFHWIWFSYQWLANWWQQLIRYANVAELSTHERFLLRLCRTCESHLSEVGSLAGQENFFIFRE